MEKTNPIFPLILRVPTLVHFFKFTLILLHLGNKNKTLIDLIRSEL